MIGLLYLSIGLITGMYFKENLINVLTDIRKVHKVFCEQHRTNTVVPKYIERYVPTSLIHSLETGKFVATVLWIRIEQALTQTCVKYDRYYKIQFVIDHKLYRLIIKPERGPGSELSFLSDDKDCTVDIQSYLRGNQSVVQKLTPKHLGYDSLNVLFNNERLYSISSNEHIKV